MSTNKEVKVDWTKAPEGSTHYNLYNDRFYKASDEVCYIHLADGWKESFFDLDEIQECDSFIPRPVETKKVKYKLYVNEDSNTRAFFIPKLNKLSCFPFDDETTGDEIINDSDRFIYWEVNDQVFERWFPKGLEKYLVKTVYEDGHIESEEPNPKQSFEWKIKHIKADDYKCGRDVALTILYKDIGDGYYEYKYAICSPKEMFSRKEGIKEALKKPDTWKAYVGNFEDIDHAIVINLATNVYLSSDAIELIMSQYSFFR